MDRAVAVLVHHFDQVHEVPTRDDVLGGHDGRVSVRAAVGKHGKRPIILMLIHTAIAQAHPLHPGRILDGGHDLLHAGSDSLSA